MSTCGCAVCKYRCEFVYHVENIGGSSSYDFFNEMYDRLCHAEDELDYYKMKYNDTKADLAQMKVKLL